MSKICNFKIIGDFHIDHILQFNIIVKQFLENNTINIPTLFDENKYNMRIFKKVDILFSDAFYNYHKDVATLRKVCAKCNLSRPKN